MHDARKADANGPLFGDFQGATSVHDENTANITPIHWWSGMRWHAMDICAFVHNEIHATMVSTTNHNSHHDHTSAHH